MALIRDFRGDKMESREGLGRALERRRRWEDSIPSDVKEAAWAGGESVEAVLGAEGAAKWRKEMQAEAKERAELMGFWVAWHCAGGFEGLEAGGWNRATLFRKVKRFRLVFGDHPDEHTFDFLRVMPDRLWSQQLREALDFGLTSD